MPITDEQFDAQGKRLDTLGRTTRETSKSQKDLLKLFGDLERRLEALERGAAHRTLDLLHASPSLQKAAGVVLVVLALAGAVMAAPDVIPLIPLIGGVSVAK